MKKIQLTVATFLMFNIVRRVTNTRPEQDATPFVSTAPTKGIIKVSSSAAAILKVEDGSYLDIVEATFTAKEDGTLNGEAYSAGDEVSALFVGKGSAKTETESQIGSVLASTNGSKGATRLQCSSANAYQMLKGNAETKSYYTVREDLMQDTDDNGDELDTVYFPLDFTKTVAKQEKDADDVEETNDEVASESPKKGRKSPASEDTQD